MPADPPPELSCDVPVPEEEPPDVAPLPEVPPYDELSLVPDDLSDPLEPELWPPVLDAPVPLLPDDVPPDDVPCANAAPVPRAETSNAIKSLFIFNLSKSWSLIDDIGLRDRNAVSFSCGGKRLEGALVGSSCQACNKTYETFPLEWRNPVSRRQQAAVLSSFQESQAELEADKLSAYTIPDRPHWRGDRFGKRLKRMIHACDSCM